MFIVIHYHYMLNFLSRCSLKSIDRNAKKKSEVRAILQPRAILHFNPSKSSLGRTHLRHDIQYFNT